MLSGRGTHSPKLEGHPGRALFMLSSWCPWLEDIAAASIHLIAKQAIWVHPWSLTE